MMKMIQRLAENKDFESQEDLERYLNQNLVGKTPEELAAMMADEIAPSTPEEHADLLLEELSEDSTPEEIANKAREALDISQDSISAWLLLGTNEPDATLAMEHVEQGIRRGMARFREELEAADGELGIWGDIAARDLIRLMVAKAKLLESGGEMEEAVAVYREVLHWNPQDNLGARGDLLLLLMFQRRIEEARALLDAHPNDSDTTMAWGRALVSIVATMDRTGYELTEDEDPTERYDTPQAFLKSLGPEFDESKKAFRQAAKVNPFVPLFFGEAGLFEVETSSMIAIGGPYEAINYLQKWAILWYIIGLPVAMLTAAAPRNVKKYFKQRVLSEELMDIAEQLENHDGPPWWEALDDLDPDETARD